MVAKAERATSRAKKTERGKGIGESGTLYSARETPAELRGLYEKEEKGFKTSEISPGQGGNLLRQTKTQEGTPRGISGKGGRNIPSGRPLEDLPEVISSPTGEY